MSDILQSTQSGLPQNELNKNDMKRSLPTVTGPRPKLSSVSFYVMGLQIFHILRFPIGCNVDISKCQIFLISWHIEQYTPITGYLS